MQQQQEEVSKVLSVYDSPDRMYYVCMGLLEKFRFRKFYLKLLYHW